MPELGAYKEDVQFNWDAAEKLAKELRSTADALYKQIGERKRIGARTGAGPLAQWEGSYARQFDERLSICTSDADKFVISMREAAKNLDNLAKLAREEQQRRELAREWVKQQENQNWFERNIADPVSDFFGGEDVPPPPPPVDPPKIPIIYEPSKSRGPSTPSGHK